MKVTYDSVADAMYISFNPKRKSTKTEEIREGLNVDYAGRKLIGIEILDASEKLSPKDLDKMIFEGPTYKPQLTI